MSDHTLAPSELSFIEKTVNEHRNKILGFIKRRIPKEDDAEDLLQDVFYKFINSYRNITNKDNVISWLFTVAKNRITDAYRKKQEASMPIVSVNEDDSLMLSDLLTSISLRPDSEMEKEAIWNDINEALDELPKEQKEVFVWHEFEDKSFQEMEDMTGVNKNTLLSRKRYAILSLRKSLQYLYDDLE